MANYRQESMVRFDCTEPGAMERNQAQQASAQAVPIVTLAVVPLNRYSRHGTESFLFDGADGNSC